MNPTLYVLLITVGCIAYALVTLMVGVGLLRALAWLSDQWDDEGDDPDAAVWTHYRDPVTGEWRAPRSLTSPTLVDTPMPLIDKTGYRPNPDGSIFDGLIENPYDFYRHDDSPSYTYIESFAELDAVRGEPDVRDDC